MNQQFDNRQCMAWLLLGLAFVSAGFYGRSVARRNLIYWTTAELTNDGTRLRRLIEAGRVTRSGAIQEVFEQIMRQSKLDIVGIQLRDEDGAVEASVGVSVNPSFPADFVESHEPVTTIQEYQAELIAVETFSVQWPIARNYSQWRNVVDHKPIIAPDRIGIIEIAARLNQAKARVRPRAGRLLRPPAVCLIRFTPDSVSTLFVSPVLSNNAGPKSAGTISNYKLQEKTQQL